MKKVIKHERKKMPRVSKYAILPVATLRRNLAIDAKPHKVNQKDTRSSDPKFSNEFRAYSSSIITIQFSSLVQLGDILHCRCIIANNPKLLESDP